MKADKAALALVAVVIFLVISILALQARNARFLSQLEAEQNAHLVAEQQRDDCIMKYNSLVQLVMMRGTVMLSSIPAPPPGVEPPAAPTVPIG